MKMLSGIAKKLICIILCLTLCPSPVSASSAGINIPAGNYVIVSDLGNNLVLDVSCNGTSNKSNIQVYSANNSTAQIFQLIKVSGDWYKIMHTHSGRVLDISGGSKKAKGNVQLYDWNGSNAQLWKLIPNGNGGCYIQSKLGTYLDVSNGTARPSTNVWANTADFSASKTWYLRPVCETSSVTYLKVTKQNSAVIRSGNSEKHSIVDRIPTGTILESTGSCKNGVGNTWYKIQYKGKTCYIYSGNVSRIAHHYETLEFDDVVYRVCDCGKVTVSSASQSKLQTGQNVAKFSHSTALAIPLSGGLAFNMGATEMAKYGSYALGSSAVDGILPVGDIVAILILAYGAYAMATNSPITQSTATDIAAEMDFDQYLKENRLVCSEASFRVVTRHPGGLTYVNDKCYNAIQAYFMAKSGMDMYTRYYPNALLAASFHPTGYYSEIDKDQPNYYYHFHLGANKKLKTGGHIFYGMSMSGQTPS